MIDKLGMYETIRKADMHEPVALSRHWTFTDIVRGSCAKRLDDIRYMLDKESPTLGENPC